MQINKFITITDYYGSVEERERERKGNGTAARYPDQIHDTINVCGVLLIRGNTNEIRKRFA